MAYTIGVSSGWWSIPKTPELLGLGMKTMSGATLGVNFVQADLETYAEFLEPRLKEQLKTAEDRLGINFGIHGELGIGLEVAVKDLWDIAHERFIEQVRGAAETGAKYLLLHASSTPPPSFGAAVLAGRYVRLVDTKGKTLYNLIRRTKKDKVKEYLAKKFLQGEAAERFGDYARKYVEKNMKGEIEKLLKEKLNGYPESERKIELEHAFRGQVIEYLRDENIKEIAEKFLIEELEQGKSIPYDVYDERDAYEVVAMELEGSKSWNEICCTDYVRNQLKAQLGKEYKGDASITVENMANSSDRKVQALLSTLVAIEYIKGHFDGPMQYRDQRTGEFVYKGTIKDFIKENNVTIVFETPQVEERYEGLMRITSTRHIYKLVEEIGLKENVMIAVDFEHMLTHNLDPGQEIKELPENAGAFVKVIHVGQPKPLHPAHAPIEVGSEAQEILYEWLYQLRKKGFKDGYIIFERGGGKNPGEWLGKSIEAIRLIVQGLEKDIQPEKLPKEFYGISPTSTASEQRQKEIVHEHFLDPLKGVLAIPEEEHTFLSKFALERPGVTPEKLKKEELK